MSDVKTLLKEARKLVDEKNYLEAQECCKNVLRKDKQNYMALVFLGKALQDADQAPLAYQKAIASKPDYPLAWLGLASYYERKEDVSIKSKLFNIYNEILKLQIEDDKAIEVITKLGQLGTSLNDYESIRIFMSYLINSNNSKLIEAGQNQLISLLKLNISCCEEDIPDIVKLLSNIYEKDPNDSLEKIIVKVLLQQSNMGSALKQVLGLQFFNGNVVVRELVCKFLCESYVKNESFLDFDIQDQFKKITNGIENSKYPGLLQSMINYDKKLYLDAYTQTVPLINYHQADETEAKFIIMCTIKLKNWSITQKLATTFLARVKDDKFAIVLQKFLFLSLYMQQKWNEAISVIQHIHIQNFNVSELAMLAECYIQNDQPVEHILQNLVSTKHFIELQAILLLKDRKYKEVVQLLENDANSARSLFYLGKALWKLQNYEKCLINLLKAAKVDSEHAETFLYLGHFYYFHKNDLEKSKKCYEKSYNLNATNNNIAKSLSDLYSKLGKKNEDFNLLCEAEKNVVTNEAWISFKLGLHYLCKREWENAIIKFRHVIKTNPSDTTAFECLADAYFSRGSFTSALRAYNKVMTIDHNKKPYCLTRISYIYSLLTQYEEAISNFEKVLLIDPQSLLALKGIAETWMRIAKKRIESKMYGSARDCAQNAIQSVTKALSKQKQHSCFWKIMADTLMFITRLPDKYAYVYLTDTANDSEPLSKIDKLAIFSQAIACYSRLAKQKGQFTSYDLASAYLSYYNENKNVVNCNISFNLALALTKSKPWHWRNWNLLGKICLWAKKYNVAQHCFIKALQVTRKWSIAQIWCNLGTLYLKLKLYKLANYCFWRGQSILPSHPHSWIGQGLIAEVLREDEAMDLFRHASRLGYHQESALGYADWVCRTIKNNYKTNPEQKYVIEGLHAIPYAIDLLVWYSTYEPQNACALTMLGILLEQSNLLQSALESYEKAFQYAEDDKKNIALLNIGRILVRTEKYDEAIKVYKAISEASFNTTCGLALALFKKGFYEEAYAAYDTALQWLSNDDIEKSDLLVAMSGIIYMFKGVNDAKTLLFHSIQQSQNKPTANSLFAICSLALIHSDQSLSKLAQSELQKYEKEADYGFDIGFLKSFQSVCEDDLEQAIKLLSETLHDHPCNAMLWFYISQYCLMASNTRARNSSCCAQRALSSAKHGGFNDCCGKMLATASIAEHISGNHAKDMLLAKEGLHMFPNQAEIWAALLFTLISQNNAFEKRQWISEAVKHMRKNFDISRPLTKWLNILEKKLVK